MKSNLVKLATMVSCLVVFAGCSSSEPSASKVAKSIERYYSENWVNNEVTNVKVSDLACQATDKENLYSCEAEVSFQCKESGDPKKGNIEFKMKKANNEWHINYLRGGCGGHLKPSYAR